MSMDLLQEFQGLLGKFQTNPEPKTKEDVGQQLAELAELLNAAEKILTYFAMHQDSGDDVLTYLFEYKELLKLQNHLEEIRHALPHAAPIPTEAPPQKPWWGFWKK